MPSGTLDDFIKRSVGMLSSNRLAACVQDKQFPLEASFQHLPNETMTLLLPPHNSVKPEYRTKAPGLLGDKSIFNGTAADARLSRHAGAKESQELQKAVNKSIFNGTAANAWLILQAGSVSGGRNLRNCCERRQK